MTDKEVIRIYEGVWGCAPVDLKDMRIEVLEFLEETNLTVKEVLSELAGIQSTIVAGEVMDGRHDAIG